MRTPPSPRRGDDQGFAMIAVLIILTVLLLMTLVAFADTSYNQNNTRQSLVIATADQAADAGLSNALYQLQAGNFYCQFTPDPVSPSKWGTPVNVPSGTPSGISAGYTIGSSPQDVVYKESNGTAYPACTGMTSTLGSTPASVQLSSTGTATFGPFVASETVTEDLTLTAVSPQNMAVFDGSGLTLSSMLQIAAPTSPNTEGEVYSDGAITSPSTGCGPGSFNANLVSAGDTLIQGACTIAGTVDAIGNVTLEAGAQAQDDVTAANGNLTMSNATVSGNVTAVGSSGSGNIELCPSTANCTDGSITTSGKTGPSSVGGTATASGTVMANSAYYSTTSPCAGSPSPDKITGCITASSGNTPISSSAGYPFPSLALPTGSSSPWGTAGYTYEPVGCSDSAVTTAINAETGPTVIAPPDNCALTLSTAPKFVYDTAIFAPCGVTVTSNKYFNTQATGAGNVAEISLIVPSSGASCGATTPNMTVAAGLNPPAANIQMFFYSPNTFDFSGGGTASISGQVFARTVGSVSTTTTSGATSYTTDGLTAAMKLTYEPFLTGPYTSRSNTAGVPGLFYSYDVEPTVRYVSATSAS